MIRPFPKPFLSSLCSLALIALPAAQAPINPKSPSAASPTLKPKFLPAPASPCILRAGDIRILGAEEGKLTVDISGKNKNNIDDLRYRLTSSGGNAELHVSGGPRNDLTIEVRVPRNSELYARISAGDVTIENITGSKDVELHAGDLTISVGNPDDYSHVEASVGAGDITAAPFGEERGGIFRSFKKSGKGKFTLYAHVGAGDLTLK